SASRVVCTGFPASLCGSSAMRLLPSQGTRGPRPPALKEETRRPAVSTAFDRGPESVTVQRLELPANDRIVAIARVAIDDPVGADHRIDVFDSPVERHVSGPEAARPHA